MPAWPIDGRMSRTGSIRRKPALAATLVVAALAGCGVSGRSGPPPLETQAVALDSSSPRRTALGKLEYRGGLALAMDDDAFGGWSGLWVSEDGRRLLAVGDQGRWLTARLDYDADGRLAEAADARLGPLRDEAGQPLLDKAVADAEALAVAGDTALVAFERQNRIWRYPLAGLPGEGVASALASPLAVAATAGNRGIESLAALPGGRLLALAEGLAAAEFLPHAATRGWLWDGSAWAELGYGAQPPFRPSDAAALPNGDLLVVERTASLVQGVRIRLMRVKADAIRPGALLAGEELAVLAAPLTVDNIEGVAIRPQPDGSALIYLLSDDNFSALQKTLLLLFRLPPG